MNKVEVQSVKLYPLVVKGTRFSTMEVLNVNSSRFGNLTTPSYDVKDDSDGSITANVTQEYLLKFTGIKMNGTLKVADIWIGSPVYSNLWTVSLSKDFSKMYCCSPSSTSTERFMYGRIYDEFGINVIPFVESAVLRMVLGFLGPDMKKRFFVEPTKYEGNDKSCANCRAVRYKTISDTKIGDANNPTDGGSGTWRIRTDGIYTNNLICAYTGESVDVDNDIDRLNKEYIHGDHGTDYLNKYTYTMKADGCSKYINTNTNVVHSSVHDVELDGEELTITTAGVEVYFNIGASKWQLPVKKIPRPSALPKKCHSGGADGADTIWGEVGEHFGVKTYHYYKGKKTPRGNTVVSDFDSIEGSGWVRAAAKILGRNPRKQSTLDLLIRNWCQVKYSDSIFAISEVNPDGTVKGGTGWAVEMAKLAEKEIYVFDQVKNAWFKYDYLVKDFITLEKTPMLTQNFAGIGARVINDNGINAITDIYEMTFIEGSK